VAGRPSSAQWRRGHVARERPERVDLPEGGC